jgi:hypothetical protein
MTKKDLKDLYDEDSFNVIKHPANTWKWDDNAEEQFSYWFNEIYGNYSLRSEWFYGDCLIEDEKTRQNMLYRWLHSAYVAGYYAGSLNQHHKNLDKTYDKIEEHIEETDELLKEVDEYLEK